MQGTIAKWDDEKGFGFILIDGSQKEIFCHISDFLQKRPRPEIGETVAFEVASNEKGKFAAKRIRYLHRKVKTTRPRTTRSSLSLSGIFSIAVGLVFFGLMSYEIYQFVAVKFTPKQKNVPLQLNSSPSLKSSSSKYRCDGRQHCSQMTSCEEAKWFLRHCADTKMDGDGDGIPCESTLCGGSKGYW